MGHVPHVFLDGPWDGDLIDLPDRAGHHLRRVLRRADGSDVSYTDGAGMCGEGTLDGDHVRRGPERAVPAPNPSIVLAVAPPKANDRTRFLVEKAAELAVREIRWLRTRRGEGRAPRPDRVRAWATGALEQARGAWMTTVADGIVGVDELATTADSEATLVLAAHPGGVPLRSMAERLGDAGRVVVAVGPEGGFAPDELPSPLLRVDLGNRILRVETAAVAVVAALRLG